MMSLGRFDFLAQREQSVNDDNTKEQRKAESHLNILATMLEFFHCARCVSRMMRYMDCWKTERTLTKVLDW